MKWFSFNAAHHLPRVPIGHKCNRNHGHNYEVGVVVEGEIDPARGWVVDFEEIKKAVKPLVDQLDHRDLNDFMENPTAELLGYWFLDQLPDWVVAVQVKENPDTLVEVPA
jgi:6-pyruvoyltetrahydropterin/6-carboxytetrahydropterin synthase